MPNQLKAPLSVGLSLIVSGLLVQDLVVPQAHAQQIQVSRLPEPVTRWTGCGRYCRNYLCVSVNKTDIDVRITLDSSRFVSGRSRNNRRRQGETHLIEGPQAESTAVLHCVPIDKSVQTVSAALVQDNCTDIGGLFQQMPVVEERRQLRRHDYETPHMSLEGCSYQGSGFAETEYFGGSVAILPDSFAFGSTYVSTTGTKHAIFYSGNRTQVLNNVPGTVMQIGEHNTRIWEISFGDVQ